MHDAFPADSAQVSASDDLSDRLPGEENTRAQRRQRVLFVTPIIPLPINKGSSQRTDQTIRALMAAGVDLHVVVLNRNERRSTSDAIAARLEAAYPGCAVTVRRHPRFKAPRNGGTGPLRRLLSRWSERLNFRRLTISNRDECPPAFRRTVRRLLSGGQWDVYFSNCARVTPVRGIAFDGFKICDTHDVQSTRVRLLLEQGREFLWWRRLKCIVFQASERWSLGNFDALIAISKSEVPTLERFAGPATRVVYAPASFSPPTPTEAADAVEADPPCDLLFVASPAAPNIDGVLWFLEDVFPLILEKAEVTLKLVGKICQNEAVRAVAARFGERVVLHGFAPELGAHYAAAKIVVCPLRFGTGMKIKAVEALAHGSAIVGTSTAFDSIAARPGIDAMIADDAREFAEGVVALHADQRLRASMRDNAAALFRSQHSFDAYAAAIAGLLRSAETTARSTARAR